MSTEPLRDVRANFSDVVDRVSKHPERVTVTKNGRPVAVVMSPDDLAAQRSIARALDPRGILNPGVLY